MIFYQLDGTQSEKTDASDCRNSDGGNHSFICVCSDLKISFCIAMERANESELQKIQRGLCEKYAILPETIRCRELTIDEAHHLLDQGESNHILLSADTIFSEFEMSEFNDYSASHLSETMTKTILSEEEAVSACNKLRCSDSLRAEISRIFSAPCTDAPNIHPVHYVILSDSDFIRGKMKEILFGSLLSVGRLGNSRSFTLTTDLGGIGHQREGLLFDTETAQTMYAGEKGGAVVVQPAASGFRYAQRDGRKGIQTDPFCKLVRRYHRDVLTVFEGTGADEKIIRDMVENLPGITFVWLREDTLNREAQLSYLRNRAQEDRLPADRLAEMLPQPEERLTLPDLDRRYDVWLDDTLRTVFYPQYAYLEQEDRILSRPAGSDYAALQRMVGLSEVKRTLDQVLCFYKMQKYARQLDMPKGNVSMHMVFTGNPGTAKTTVARLFAGILRDNGVLSSGELIEVGRGDVVDRYVGGTAPRVKELFARAKGNVLFIDEAYSLMDDRSGSFGDEAINTIVQEMENARDDTVVIFAGYPREMEHFLRRNPGLNSRIAFHIPFENYSAEELLEISRLLAEDRGRRLDRNADAALLERFRAAAAEADFGNGRFARNCIEQACMRQAERLMRPGNAPSRQELEVLTAEDFAFGQKDAGKEPVRRIGFAV